MKFDPFPDKGEEDASADLLNLIASDRAEPTTVQMVAAHQTLQDPNLISGLTLPSPSKGAAEFAILSIEDLQQRALLNNPTLRQAEALVNQARGNWLQVGLYPNPNVITQQAPNNSALDMFNVFVSQPIVTGKKLQLNRSVALFDVQRAQAEADAQYLSVMNEVQIRFIEALGAQRRIAVIDELVKITEQGVGMTERLLEGEQVSEADVLQANVQLEETRILQRNARYHANATWNRLGNIIGEPELPVMSLAGSLEEEVAVLDWEQSQQRLVSQHPEILAADARISAARIQVERECAQRSPNLHLTTGIGRDFFSPQYMMYTLNFAITPPSWNRNQGNVAAATSHLNAATLERDRLQLDLSNQLAAIFQEYRTARNEVKLYRESTLPLAEKNLELVDKSYEQGEFGYLRVLTAQHDLSTARINYITALIALRTTIIKIDGLLLGGGLDPVQSHPVPSNTAGSTADTGKSRWMNP